MIHTDVSEEKIPLVVSAAWSDPFDGVLRHSFFGRRPSQRNRWKLSEQLCGLRELPPAMAKQHVSAGLEKYDGIVPDLRSAAVGLIIRAGYGA